MTAAPHPMGRLLKIRDVSEQTSLHRATIYRLIQSGEFPRALKISPQRVAWRETDIEAWKQTRQPAAA